MPITTLPPRPSTSLTRISPEEASPIGPEHLLQKAEHALRLLLGRGSQTHHSVSDSPRGLSPSKFLLASWATTSFCCGSSASQVPAADLATSSPLSLATSSLCLHPDRPRLCQCCEVSASFQLKIVELFYALSPQVLREVRGSAGTCRVCYGQLVQPEGAACAVPLVKLLTALLALLCLCCPSLPLVPTNHQVVSFRALWC